MALDLHIADFLIHRLTIYRNKRTMKPEKFKAWKDRYFFDLLFGQKEEVPYTIAPGLQMFFHKESKLSFEIFKGFEEDELDFLQHFLKPGGCFIDVGANVGLFSLYASKAIGANGRIIAFEPSSPTADKFRKNLSLNQIKGVEIVQKGLSHEPGRLQLMVAEEGYDAFNSFATPSMGGTAATEEVEVTTLDAFVADQQIRPGDVDLMKIDVEGWELSVLKGGHDFFASPEAPVLLIEFTEANAKNAGTSCAALSAYLTQTLGYTLYRYAPQGKTLTKEAPGQSYPYINLIASKGNRPAFASFNLI